MSSRSSLLKRAAVPLLALTAAAALCGSARAATATLPYYGYYSYGTGYALSEHVQLTIEDDSTWNKAVFHGQQLAQNGAAGSVEDDAVLHIGSGYYDDYADFTQSDSSHSPFPAGTYNFWCICSGVDYYQNAWNASTGGTNYLNVPSP